MILTGRQIEKDLGNSKIIIHPFNGEQLNPNSYNFRLGNEVRVVVANDSDQCIDTSLPSMTIPVSQELDKGFLIMPGRMYLGITEEIMGSSVYTTKIDGRSTTGRHGLAIHVTAGFGDVGFIGKWVLEMFNTTGYPMYIKPGVQIGQISFHTVLGELDQYNSTYSAQDKIIPAKGLK